MTQRVLVVGEPADRHVTAVVSGLRAAGAGVLVLDPTAGCPLRWRLSGPEPAAAVRADGCWHDLAALDAVWWRLKLVAGTAVLTSGGAAADFAVREWYAALESLPAVTGHARWTNPRDATATARLKPVQLAAAAAAGWRVPRTLVTNEPDELAAFVADRPAVYKVLTWYHADRGRWVFTSEVDPAAIAADPAAVRVAPCLVQERIELDHELRAVVVGDRVLAARIDARPGAGTDWRRWPAAVRIRAVRLGADVVAGLRGVQSRLALRFGAYDLAVTPSGETVFLEVNPSGQWLWLEHSCGLAVTDAVVADLLGRGQGDAVEPIAATGSPRITSALRSR